MFYPIFVRGDEVLTLVKEEFEQLYNKDKKQFDDDFLSEIIKSYEIKGCQTVVPMSGDHYGRWRWGYSSKNIEKLKTDIIVVNTSNGITLYKKQRPEIGDLPSKKPKTLMYKPTYSSGNGTSQVKKLLGGKFFSNPKPKDLIMDLLLIGVNVIEDPIILDFFAGSGTTGDAVMQLNAEDGGRRKFILAQLPEKIDPDKSKASYDFVKNELGVEEPTIFEITKERLIRAANKLREERPVEVADRIWDSRCLRRCRCGKITITKRKLWRKTHLHHFGGICWVWMTCRRSSLLGRPTMAHRSRRKPSIAISAAMSASM